MYHFIGGESGKFRGSLGNSGLAAPQEGSRVGHFEIMTKVYVMEMIIVKITKIKLHTVNFKRNWSNLTKGDHKFNLGIKTWDNFQIDTLNSCFLKNLEMDEVLNTENRVVSSNRPLRSRH